MKKTALVILWGTLAAANVGAQQVCPSGIPQTTPTADFTDHGNGTVTHQPTGLMWKQCMEGLSGAGCSSGAVSSLTWQQALQLADGHIFAGYSDWRLPNIKELRSIVERACSSPAVNLSVFPNDSGSIVWTGSPHTYNEFHAWGVYFDLGYARSYWRSDSGGTGSPEQTCQTPSLQTVSCAPTKQF